MLTGKLLGAGGFSVPPGTINYAGNYTAASVNDVVLYAQLGASTPTATGCTSADFSTNGSTNGRVSYAAAYDPVPAPTNLNFSYAATDSAGAVLTASVISTGSVDLTPYGNTVGLAYLSTVTDSSSHGAGTVDSTGPDYTSMPTNFVGSPFVYTRLSLWTGNYAEQTVTIANGAFDDGGSVWLAIHRA